MSTLAIILLVGLAGARVVRLWRDDSITEGLRDRVDGWLTVKDPETSRWAPLAGWLTSLLECPWCLSAWITVAFVAFIDSATSRSVDLPVLAWLASWWVACVAYWLAELIADRDALAWDERDRKGLT